MQADWEMEFAKYQVSPEFKRVNRWAVASAHTSQLLEIVRLSVNLLQEHVPGGIQIHILDGVCASHVGQASWPLLCRASCLFCRKGIHKSTAGISLGPAVSHGRHTRPCGLVDGQERPAGISGAERNYALKVIEQFMNRHLIAIQDPEQSYETPRVSPYRLAAHLTSAFIIYSVLFWTSASLAWPLSAAANPQTPAACVAGAAALRRWALPVAGLIAITGISGKHSI